MFGVLKPLAHSVCEPGELCERVNGFSRRGASCRGSVAGLGRVPESIYALEIEEI